jgi:hypothetical protein
MASDALDAAEQAEERFKTHTPSFFSPGSWKTAAHQYEPVPTAIPAPGPPVQRVQLPPPAAARPVANGELSSDDEKTAAGVWSAPSSPTKGRGHGHNHSASLTDAPRARSLRTVRPVAKNIPRPAPVPARAHTLWAPPPTRRSMLVVPARATTARLTKPHGELDTVLHGTAGGRSNLSSLASRETACSEYSTQSGEARRKSSSADFLQRFRRARESRAAATAAVSASAEASDDEEEKPREGFFEHAVQGGRRRAGQFGV